MPEEVASKGAASSATLAPIGRDLFDEIEVTLEARLGKATLTIEDVLKLKAGSAIKLETTLADNVEIYLNGAIIARGEVVAVGDNFGVKLVEVADRG